MLSDMQSCPVCVLQFRPGVGSFVCVSYFLPTCLSSTNSHVIFSMPNCSISSIPNSTGPSPGTTKNLHLATLFLCLNLAEQTPSSFMFELLCVCFTTAVVVFVACNAFIVDFQNSILKILNGIGFTLAPESIL